VRDAQIEAALERVRSRTLAMHRSDELGETAAVVFKQLITLGIEPNRLYISIIKDESGEMEFWITDEDGSKVSKQFIGNVNGNESIRKMFDGWIEKKKSITIDMDGDELKNYFHYLNNELNVPFKGGLSQKRRVQNISYFSKGFIGMASPDEQPVETTYLLERFAAVFNLTYARFNDLQNAEAQTQKAQIETALEKVRARALAMHQPEELIEVAQVLREQMGLLKIEELETSTIFIHDKNSDKSECWFADNDKRETEDKSISGSVTLQLNQTNVGRKLLEFFNSDEVKISIQLQSEDKMEWVKYVYSVLPAYADFYGDNIPDRTYYLYKFSNGAIGASSSVEITEQAWDLLKRSASVFSLAYSRFKDLTQARNDLILLKEEKQRSDSLLLNILPEEIAAELKQFGKSYARKHEQVSILFADIKGFSTISENLSATELVTQLDECFRAFDYIVEKHGLEKIKTIGDAYVCACGLPKPVDDNAAKTVGAALDMLDFIKGFGLTKKIQGLPAFEFRIGIHTGPVITGVVGLKKFTYDIWGDAVNVAARMEQHGETGKINISENSYQLIKNKFKCTHRGSIEAKNKGMVDMYFVEGNL
ncbi:MAG: adenylate/guanylate cyclase domain-containing protein, partial [bacterium]